MTLELSIVISVLSVSFALYSGISNLKRNDKKDTAEETAQLTTVIVKLAVEQSAKSAHHRLDGLTGGVDA